MLLNVRLGPVEQRAVRGLRRRKVNVSELVRAAIRSAAADTASKEPSALAIVKKVLAEIPATGRSARRPPLDDRKAVAAFLRRKIGRR